MKRRSVGPSILMITLLVLFAVCLIYPIWLTIEGAFVSYDGGFTLYHIGEVFTNEVLRNSLLNALAIAGCTTLLSIIISLPLAGLTARYDFPGKKVFGALILVPLILPPFVGAIGLTHLLGRSGAINTLLIDLGLLETGFDFIGKGGFWAIVVIEALHLYPIIYLNATASLANLDPALTEAAENVGAGPWSRFTKITLPLIRPGLFAGSTIVFIWSFTELGTPLMFDYQQVAPVQIFQLIKEMSDSQQPYALTAVMLAIAIGIYVVGKFFFGRRGHEMYAKASVQAIPKKLKGIAALGALTLCTVVVLMAVSPHISVVLSSLAVDGSWYQSIFPQQFTLQYYDDALTHPLAMGSIENSLVYSVCAVAIDLGIGLLIAYLIVRTRIWGRTLLDSLSMLPLAVPGLVMAFGYVAVTLRWPFGEGDPLEGVLSVTGAEPNPAVLLVIAYAVRRLPYVVRATASGLEQTSGQLEEAALNMGASKLRAIRTIIVPLIMANLIAGALLAFSFAMLEVSDSIILAQREADFPMTKAIYVLFERLGDGPAIASAMGVWGMALLAATLIGASVMMGKKMGAIFRV